VAARVHYLLVCSAGVDLRGALLQLLGEVLEDDVPDEESLASAIEIRYEFGRADGRMICGVTIAFAGEEETDAARIDQLSIGLGEASDEGIEHALKLEDTRLQLDNSLLARDIFEI
jgi:hypothetical protein